MNIKALITALVLGSSSLALASPSWSGGVQVTTASRYGHGPVVRDHRGWGEEQPAPVVRDHRGDFDGDRDRDGSRNWVELNQVAMANGHEAVYLNSNERFSTVMIKSATGCTNISEIHIGYANGEVQIVRDVDQRLDGSNPMMTVALDQRSPVRRIVIYGNGDRGASNTVFAI